MMLKTHALVLALVLASSVCKDNRWGRFCRRKESYVATLLLRPEDYRLLGLVEKEDGIDLLWQYTGCPGLQFPA